MKELILQLNSPCRIFLENGCLSRIGSILRGIPLSPCGAVLVTDDGVPASYLDTAELSLRESGFRVSRVTVTAGEKAKSWQQLGCLLEHFSVFGLQRGDLVIALGGGVIGDLAGFASSVYLRGVRCVQVPTTLLAMIDSSVGGKTAVNLSTGKNLAGAFHQPTAVICDPALLNTLPERVSREGFGEIVKCGVLAGGRLWELLQSGAGVSEEMISLCLSYKCVLVEQDEQDLAQRRLLNLGHTFGHAVELIASGSLLHGECVSIGLSLIARGAAGRGLCSCADEIVATLKRYGLPTECPYSAEALLPAVFRDKKADGLTIDTVIPAKIGKCERMRLGLDTISDMLSEALSVHRENVPVTVNAIPSKSQLHRFCIAAALGARPVTISHVGTLPADVIATLDCLSAMGGGYEFSGQTLTVFPICATQADSVILPCGESGSTLRFLLPICGALGLTGRFAVGEQLTGRPLQPLSDALRTNGMDIRFSANEREIFFRGQLLPGLYEIPGNVSSQFLSGLLFALPLLQGTSCVALSSRLESSDYVRMTLDTLCRAGIAISDFGDHYLIKNAVYRFPEHAVPEGDWSNAAFFLCAGAVGKTPVRVTGLDPDSLQGDQRIVALLRQFGARVETGSAGITVYPAELHGIRADCTDIPDLVPPLCLPALAANGETVLTGVSRLRYKECDRLSGLSSLIRSLGGYADESDSALSIRGGQLLSGGCVDVRHDHRLAMTAYMLQLLARQPVSPNDTDCTAKSDPDFQARAALILSEGKPSI